MSRAVDTRGIVNVSRRDVLKGGAALTLAIAAAPLLKGCAEPAQSGATALSPNGFLRVESDGTVTVISKHLEMGQGVYTGLATLVAEELDADWSQVRVEGAPANTEVYRNLGLGMQGTGGSTSIANSWEQYRTAGATARAMLVTAAARRWNVPESEIGVVNGVASHAGSNRSAKLGELVAEAATLPVPEKVGLKDPARFALIGKGRPRVDVRAKSTGTATFTQDLKLPGMLTAVVAHPPRFGAKVKGFDAAAAKAVKGVVNVVAFETPVRSGVAVLAPDYWTAKKARDALKVEWDESGAFRKSSEELWREYRSLAAKPGSVARKEGDVDQAFRGAARVIEASYELPYLAHASMEPLNCVVQIGDDGCEIWNGEQFQTADQAAVAGFLGLPPEKVRIHMLFAGGSFGRRANPKADYILEAVAIAKAAGTKAPVKLVWSREEDMRAGFYRPMYFHALKAGVDRSGRIVAWQHRIVGQSVFGTAGFPIQGPVDPSSVEGASNLPYAVPNLLVDLHTTELPVPIQWWRSVGSSHTAYAIECFVDDIARATRADPLQLRRTLLGDKHPRHTRVLDLVAEKSGWNSPLPPGKARGIALHESFNSVVAEVVEVARSDNGFKVERVVCAVDCGIAVNPNIVAMQMESGIGYGLSAAINGAITLRDGAVEQSNFHDYPALRMSQMPRIEVHIYPSTDDPTGVGEPGTPPIAPAVANALAVLTGKALRSLPFSKEGVEIV